jgi:hypothetical protein
LSQNKTLRKTVIENFEILLFEGQALPGSKKCIEYPAFRLEKAFCLIWMMYAGYYS